MTLLAVVVAFAILLTLVAFEVPIAFSLGVSGAAGLLVLEGFGPATQNLASLPYSTVAVFTLTLIPMFVLMGLFASESGMLEEVFSIAQKSTMKVPGGLGMAAIVACIFFGGISGSSIADAATIGRVTIGEMDRQGYEKAYAAAMIATAGTVAIMIPPSIALVIYGILTGESIGALLLAGIVPGVLSGIAYLVIVYFKGLRTRQRQAESQGRTTGERADPENDVATAAPERLRRSSRILPVSAMTFGATLFFIVIGGIYFGIFTATEAGAIGALSSLVLSAVYVWLRNRTERQGTGIVRVAIAAGAETASVVAMVFTLIVGAAIFTRFLVLSRVPVIIGDWVLGSDLSPYLIVAIFLLVLLPMGMFLDGFSMLLIVAPLAYPIVSDLGFSGIWFGVLFIKMIEVGLVTPPLGINVYVVAGLFEDVSVEDVFKAILPFLAADLAVVALLFSVPSIVTFLPSGM